MGSAQKNGMSNILVLFPDIYFQDFSTISECMKSIICDCKLKAYLQGFENLHVGFFLTAVFLNKIFHNTCHYIFFVAKFPCSKPASV
jgi:hypothetical protein